MRSKWLAPVVIVLMLAFGAAVFRQLPDEIPSHWNLTGQVNDQLPKTLMVVLLPSLVLVIWLVGQLTVRVRFLGQTVKSATTSQAILNLIVLSLAIIHVITLGSALGWQLPVPRALTFVLGLLLALMGNQMPRLKPNPFIGIRAPWTLRDPGVWRRTHRLRRAGLTSSSAG